MKKRNRWPFALATACRFVFTPPSCGRLDAQGPFTRRLGTAVRLQIGRVDHNGPWLGILAEPEPDCGDHINRPGPRCSWSKLILAKPSAELGTLMTPHLGHLLAPCRFPKPAARSGYNFKLNARAVRQDFRKRQKRSRALPAGPRRPLARTRESFHSATRRGQTARRSDRKSTNARTRAGVWLPPTKTA